MQDGGKFFTASNLRNGAQPSQFFGFANTARAAKASRPVFSRRLPYDLERRVESVEEALSDFALNYKRRPPTYAVKPVYVASSDSLYKTRPSYASKYTPKSDSSFVPLQISDVKPYLSQGTRPKFAKTDRKKPRYTPAVYRPPTNKKPTTIRA